MFYVALTLLFYAAYHAFHFNEAVRQRVAAHEARWGPGRLPGPSGLSAFQQTAEERVAAALAVVGVELADRAVEALGDGTAYIELRPQPPEAGPTVWLYSELAVLATASGRLTLGEWDAPDPEALAVLVAARAAELAPHRPPAA